MFLEKKGPKMQALETEIIYVITLFNKAVEIPCLTLIHAIRSYIALKFTGYD